MSNNHILTKSGTLRGFSTDNSYDRPFNVADRAINLQRSPDKSLEIRRGYQCQIAAIGGLGTGTFDDPTTGDIKTVTINRDALLYEKLTKNIYFNYTPSLATRYLQFTIFTDARYLTTNPGWSVAPWSLSPWGSPAGESITCQITVNRAAQVNGNQNNVNTIIVDVGHEFAAPGNIVLFTNSAGVQQQRNVTAVAANSITVDGPVVSVLDNVYISKFFDIPFRRGFDVASPYLISTFIGEITSVTTGIEGLQVDVNGDTSYPAAFLQIVEPIIIDINSNFEMEYWYWEAVNKTVAVTFSGASTQAFQNSPDFENATFATVDDVIYIANGIDYPQKYDGQTVYRVGMPNGVRPRAVAANVGAGKLVDGNYSYAITYEQIDALGHLVEGAISETFQITISGGPSDVDVIVSNILTNSGWNTDGALATAAAPTGVYGPDLEGFFYLLFPVSTHDMQIGDSAYYKDREIARKNGLSVSEENTFTVNAGHGVLVGDTVTFLNTANDTQVRVVTGVDLTSITVEGNPVIVAANTPFIANKSGLVFGNIAIVNGAQNNVNTINIHTTGAGSTIQANDIVSFVDTSDRVQRRNVTSVGVGTITIDGNPVSVADLLLIESETIRATQFSVRREVVDGAVLCTGATLSNGDPISNNLRINIWRTSQDGTILQLLTTLPNNSQGSATQTFRDTIQSSRKTGAISGATQANPCVITSDAHGLKTGYQITIDDIDPGSMQELNGRNYTITFVNDDQFSLNGVDSTGYTAYVSGGKWQLIFSDNSQLGIDFPDPIRRPDPPPISKYVLAYGNQLLYAGGEQGNPENDDNVFFSEGNQPEAVPAATNFFTVPSPDDVVTGIGIAGTTLIVAKNQSTYAVTGDLLTSQFQVATLSPGSNIGCVAHATMKSVGSLLYMLDINGIYAIVENQFYPTDKLGNPVPLSEPIDAIFRESNFLPSTKFVLKRAVACNYAKDRQYLLFLPCENTGGTQRVANANSILLCYDYNLKDWYTWIDINAAGGIFVIKDDLYFHERRFSGVVGNTSNLYKQHRFYRLVDHADHTSSQRAEWRSSWEDLGLPEVRKKFSRCMMLIDRISDLQQFNNPQMYFSTYLNRIPNLQSTQAIVTTVDNIANSGWSISPWGWNIWSGYQDSFVSIPLKGGTVAKSMQVGFTITGINMNIKLSKVQLEVIPENRKTFVR